MPLAIGQTLQNRYRVDQLIGQGGYGAVYRAWDLRLNGVCAIKENLDHSSEAQRQFNREAKMMVNLRHPNLPRVVDHFTIPGQGQYLVMDYIEGHSLAQLFAAGGKSPILETRLLPWILQICEALTYLHTCQPPIIHRDIKPENIIITPDDRAILVDFGISKQFVKNQFTTVGARAVTPGFSPPEQYGNGKTDARSDIYALGALLYTLLTGIEPFESVDRLSGKKLLLPHVANPDITLTVSQAIVQALRLSADRRFQSVLEFRNALSAGIKIPQRQTELLDVLYYLWHHFMRFLKNFWREAGVFWIKQSREVRIGIFALIILTLCCGNFLFFSPRSSTYSSSSIPTRHVSASLPITGSLPATFTPIPTLPPHPTFTPRSLPTSTPRLVVTLTRRPLSPLQPTSTYALQSEDSIIEENSIVVDEWEVRVERVLIADRLTGISGGEEKAEGRFALVFMAATNRGLSRDIFIAYGVLQVQDAQGGKYNENSLASAYAAYMHDTEGAAYVNPDETGYFVAVFDISRQGGAYWLTPGPLAQEARGQIPLRLP